MNVRTPCLLSIAGSDSSGGAGIQADTKVCTALGVHCATAITSITAQNTKGVQQRYDMPCGVLRDQLTAVFEDMNVAVVKLGMLGSLENVLVVADVLTQFSPPIVIADPVIRSTSGAELLDQQALSAYADRILPQLDILTPNLSEAAVLLNRPEAKSVGDMEEQAYKLVELGPQSVVLKGGHLPGQDLVEVVVSQDSIVKHQHQRIDSPNTHGTGCYLSTAIGAYMLQGMDLNHALKQAIEFIEQAILNGADVMLGGGTSPLQASACVTVLS